MSPCDDSSTHRCWDIVPTHTPCAIPDPEPAFSNCGSCLQRELSREATPASADGPEVPHQSARVEKPQPCISLILHGNTSVRRSSLRRLVNSAWAACRPNQTIG